METQKVQDFTEAVKVQEDLLSKQNYILENTNESLKSMTDTSAQLTTALKTVNESTDKQIDLLNGFIETKEEITKHFDSVLEKSDEQLANIVTNKKTLDEIKILIESYPDLVKENKEQLLSKIAEVYPTDKLIEVIESIKDVKLLLDKVDYKAEVTALSDSLVKYKEDINSLHDITKTDTDHITKKVDELTESFKVITQDLDEHKSLTQDFISLANTLNEKYDIINTKLESILPEQTENLEESTEITEEV